MDNGRLNLFSQMPNAKAEDSTISIELNTVKDINSKNQKYNLVVSVFNAKDNYIKNNISNHGVLVEYKKEDLTQVNPQLYEWLATINDKSSNNSISENSEKINTFDKKIDDERKSISKNERFTPARYTQMSQSEDLIKELEKIDESTFTAEEAALRLSELGYSSDINQDNVWDMLNSIRSEVRDYATSEREAYRESNKKDGQSRTPVPTEDNELLTEEDANKVAKESLDYWVNNGDFTQGSVTCLKDVLLKL